MDLRSFLRTSQVARRLDVSAARVQQLREEGKLPAVWTALGFLFREEDVERVARARKARTNTR